LKVLHRHGEHSEEVSVIIKQSSKQAVALQSAIRPAEEAPRPMIKWESESLALLNDGQFRITDAGPLHTPIHSFSLRRDDKLRLILETEAAPDAKPAVPQPQDGMASFATAQVELTNITAARALLSGVITKSVATRYEGSTRGALTEVARVHELTVITGNSERASYTVEWVENLPSSPFIWPDSIKTETETVTTHGIALSNDGITISDSIGRSGVRQTAAKLRVAGETLYVCAMGKDDFGAGVKPGYIVYVGTPSGDTRKKIRIALSFALGIYLIELGHTIYDQEWRMVSSSLRSAYSLDNKVFDLVPMPLAPLSQRNFRYDLDRGALARMANALVCAYDEFDLGNLSWAYWHARAATIHIASAHFGAAIEALQRAWLKSHQGTVPTKILTPAQWEEFQTNITSLIASINTTEDNKKDLGNSLGNINRVPQRTILKAVLKAVGLEVGSKEDGAWKRRNDAAHGLPIPEGRELAAIVDVHLLEVLFHRMLLRICNATDLYVDYASPNFPYRKLAEPAGQ
jgi:hypothetical protein